MYQKGRPRVADLVVANSDMADYTMCDSCEAGRFVEVAIVTVHRGTRFICTRFVCVWGIPDGASPRDYCHSSSHGIGASCAPRR